MTPTTRTYVLTLLAMMAFAGNSLLCRLALKETGIDAASFTMIRIGAGAIVLWLIIATRSREQRSAGTWKSAAALFAYAAGFSFAYLSLPSGIGALLLFGAVQATMIGYGLYVGERLARSQTLGLLMALGGLVGLLLPGLTAPPMTGCLLMLFAGVAWGIYSLRGRGASDPTLTTAGNFLMAFPFAVSLWLLSSDISSLELAGVFLAILSGGLASGLGYVIWYAALRELDHTTSAIVQLSVPVLTAVGGILFLGESITLRLVAASTAILTGVAMVVLGKRQPARSVEDASSASTNN